MNQSSGKLEPRDSSDTKFNTFSNPDEESLSRHKKYNYQKLNDLYNLDSNNFSNSGSHSYRNNLLLSKEGDSLSNRNKPFNLFRDSKSSDSTTATSSSAGEEESFEKYPSFITPENYLILTDCKIICKNLKRYNRRNGSRNHIGAKKSIGTSHKKHDKMEFNVTDATASEANESESATQLDFDPSTESTNLQTTLDELVQNPPKPAEDSNKTSLAYMLSKEHSDAIKRHWTAVGSPEEKIFGEIQNDTNINVDAVKYTFGVQAVKGSDAVEIPNPFAENKVDENNEMLFDSKISKLSIEASTSAVSDATLAENQHLKHDFHRDSQNHSVTDKGSGVLLEKSSEISNDMNKKYGQLMITEMDASDTNNMRCCRFEKCAAHTSETDKSKPEEPRRRKRNFLFRFFGNICGKGED